MKYIGVGSRKEEELKKATLKYMLRTVHGTRST
jgi:hypothetical protein